MKRTPRIGDRLRPKVPINAWLTEPMPRDVKLAVDRLARAPDIQRLAIMPDVHLAERVCIGVVAATTHVIYPQAVGGDIGCGMSALAFDAEADALLNENLAADVLDSLLLSVPPMRHPSRHEAPPLPTRLTESEDGTPALSHPMLLKAMDREGRVEFGTLGRGNHFLELQADEEGRLWMMVHSGSRYMGQAITGLHLQRAVRVQGGLKYFDADSADGQSYLHDLAWARAYAEANRRQIATAAAATVVHHFGARADWTSYISCDHNHVRAENHFGRPLWVHRKGAAPAADGEAGIIPGSMGTCSFLAQGRGCEESLASSSHGAGRRLPREEARRRITSSDLADEMKEVRFDRRLAHSLREEAPSAYKSIEAVMRAQKALTRIVRRLRPMLVYKGV
ncbi:MAG: RtcB family protein [Phycisphaerales bacterium]|nr:RtcB family protein [Phycisphaerales bacterium]